MSMAVNQPMRRCRGLAGCTEFMKLRKLGLIPLQINDGERAASCLNVVFFTTRVTWIINHHATMVQNSWDVVDAQEKEELINRVRADFILDWSKRNHREMVEKNLGKKFNDFHYQFHKIYMGCATHQEALLKTTSLVEPDVWKKLCERWGSDEFKKVSNQNKANRKKQRVNHTPGRKSFVRLIQKMVFEVGDTSWNGRKTESWAYICWSRAWCSILLKVDISCLRLIKET
ncbi:uncharacterized protein LOC121264484 isoform X2 [Juglans microcarpa x Juglans regia]|uniref:uncharacterized protein LOC121264484 isoform X2 n=1 Tax=Juglans microcarpa x Juglans regia TaxID=2249226 RepID=UPI001B7F6D8B|nr:uncharacterized protein LOC121264484 isoform X2 [Juglans microcarpa x Juglans regia]